MYSVCSGCRRFTVSSCISWCKAAEEASKDDDDACMLEDDACKLEDDDEDEEDEDEEEVSEDCSWAVADMSGRSRHEVRRGLWLRSMLAPHCSLAPGLIYCSTTRGDKSDTRHSSCSWQFHSPSHQVGLTKLGITYKRLYQLSILFIFMSIGRAWLTLCAEQNVRLGIFFGNQTKHQFSSHAQRLLNISNETCWF